MILVEIFFLFIFSTQLTGSNLETVFSVSGPRKLRQSSLFFPFSHLFFSWVSVNRILGTLILSPTVWAFKDGFSKFEKSGRGEGGARPLPDPLNPPLVKRRSIDDVLLVLTMYDFVSSLGCELKILINYLIISNFWCQLTLAFLHNCLFPPREAAYISF